MEAWCFDVRVRFLYIQKSCSMCVNKVKTFGFVVLAYLGHLPLEFDLTDMWRITPEERAKHDQQFMSLKPVGGMVTGM